MSETQKGVNYVAVEQFLDQLRPFIIKRYCEIYGCSEEDVIGTQKDKNQYDCLLMMLETCYDEDNCYEKVV